MERIEKAPESAIVSWELQGVKTLENIKTKERSANVYEKKKGLGTGGGERSACRRSVPASLALWRLKKAYPP